MKKMNRRELCVSLPVLAAVAAGAPQAFASQQSPTAGSAQGAPPASQTVPANAKPGPVAGAGTLGAARAIPMDSVTATATANGGERRQMLHGTLATGEAVELHQSMQNPGTPAPALHVIHHSEMVLVREGTLKFQHEVDGKLVEETVGPGGVFYIAYGTNHAVSNAGPTQAQYFVVAIGGDV